MVSRRPESNSEATAPRSPLKSRPLRNPGQSLDEQIESLIVNDFLAWAIVPLVLWLVAALEWMASIRHVPRMPLLYVVLAAMGSAIVMWKFFRIRKRVRALKLGRDGERAVGQYLELLRADGAQVFHDVVADGFNVDHVVIARQGIFLIETKTWSKPRSRSRISTHDGGVFKDGRVIDPSPLTQAISAAGWLKQTLSESTGRKLTVWPVVLFPGWFVEPMDEKTRRQGWVLSGREFPAFLSREPSRLGAEDVSLCAFHLARYIRAKVPVAALEE